MSRSLASILLALAGALAAASTAQAGTVYVPLPGVSQIGTTGYEAQASIANGSAQVADVQEVLLANDTDGTQRTGTPAPLQVQPGRSMLVRPGDSFRGLLELTGPQSLRYSARLAGLGQTGGMGVYLPVLTSENLIVANRTVTLLGLVSGGTRSSDLAVVNLGQAAAQCTINLYRADGTPLGSTATIQMRPVSQRYFGNALGGLVDPGTSVSDARATVSCTQAFYAYAILANTGNGEIAYVGPAGSGESTLRVPGSQPNPTCGAGAICFTASGAVHRPTPATPVGRVTFPAPVGTFTHLRMSMDVTVGSWYAPDPDGKHLIYWFVINRNLDMPGMLYFRGPDQSVALARHGIGLKHPDKLRIQQPFQAVPGRTYHVVHDYDMGRGVLTITITDSATGQIMTTLLDTPNVRSYVFKAGDQFLIDMGFREGVVPDEVPSFNGWVYANVLLEVFP